MSTWFSEDLVCAGCGHRFAARMARGIHATRVPHVRAQILRGELHVIACPACGASSDVDHDIAYTDFDRHQWVRVARPADLVAWPRVEADALAQFDRVMAGGAALVAQLADRFRVRVVFDLDELRERLAIWDAGLDDGIVECVKLVCVRERPDLATHAHRIRVRAIAEGALEMASVPAVDPKRDRARWTVPASVVTATAADAARWRTEFPELFANGFVSIDRYLLERAPAS